MPPMTPLPLSHTQTSAHFLLCCIVAFSLAPVSVTAITHPIQFGQTWWPAIDLLHPETGPSTWPWDANAVNDTFRVMSFMDRDGNDKLYDARWAAAINIWRDWNNNQGGMCFGSTDFQVRPLSTTNGVQIRTERV